MSYEMTNPETPIAILLMIMMTTTTGLGEREWPPRPTVSPRHIRFSRTFIAQGRLY